MTWPWPTLPMLPSWNILQPSTISKLVQINSLFLPLSKWNSTTTSFCMTSCSELICKLNNLHGTETTLNFPMQKYLRPEIPKRVRDVVNEGPKCGIVGFWSLSCTFWQKIYQTKVEEGTVNIVGGSVVKLYLFFSCSDSRPHMLLYSTFQTNSFQFSHLLLCIPVIGRVYNALYTLSILKLHRFWL